VAEVVEHLPSKNEALSSNPSTIKKNKTFKQVEIELSPLSPLEHTNIP
jgi:hypothetical protein